MQPSPARVAKAGGGTPAPYGHACTNCVKAKCKCMYGDHVGACERCSRLQKDCQPSVPNRKRSQKKVPGSRTAHLEEKLDDLVSLIRSQTAVKGPNESPPVPTPASLGQTTSDGTALPSSDSSPNTVGASAATCHARSGKMNPSSSAADSELDYYVPENEALERLDLFRRDYPQFGPIVYIPPKTTAKELQQTRPLLWMSIMACTSRSTKESHLIGDKIRHIVSDRVVRQYDRSLDLLQGLLVFLCWPHSHKKENPFISIWTGIGVAIAQDLGLTAIKTETAFTFMKKFAFHGMKHPQTKEGTMEARRTLLALYVWCNTASQMLRRDNQLRWTPHMEESLRLLIEQPEWDGDRTLSVQVRCAFISEQMNDLFIQQSLSGENQISPYLIKALDGQLQDIWRTLPGITTTSRNETVLLHMYATEVLINELALHLPPSTDHADVTFRVGRLQKCLKAIENWFETYEATPPSVAVGGTFHIFVQLVICLVTIIKLSRLEDFPAWDAAEVRRRLDIFAMFDRVAARMDKIRVAVGIQEDDEREESIWAKSVKVMGLMKAGVQADWASHGIIGGEPDPSTAGSQALDHRLAMAAGSEAVMGANLQINHDALTGEFVHNFGDDPWLSAMFIPWDAMNF
ncbi:hypothetical protein KVR01_011011 [Diaporthe batatas]|uniref:uncharacterized protein n=1 Tax=Diaporthe batatas TaxID=748121 RepID=UPI001D035E9C|nr:uncharacterized protein KVR01_011011 [Diaporthe batatas]KAG8159350.1 hypothetical protein KVR01_011011 [Diaporthe batatas]